MSTALHRLSERAKADTTTRFLSIAHLLTPAALLAAFRGLRKDASAGVDAVTYADYDKDAETNVHRLHGRLVSHQYRAQPLRRVYIPKENGTERPIAIPALEDKIVQRATVTVLNAIYEQDFLPCSYGVPSRPQFPRRARCHRPDAVSGSDGICPRSGHPRLLRCDCA